MSGILVTGFDAFADLAWNVSEAVVRALPSAGGAPPGGWTTAVLPTDYVRAEAEIVRLLDVHDPDAVLLLGVARSRTTIQLERVALNLDDSATPDNAARLRTGSRIDVDGPVGFWSTLPLAAIEARLRGMGVPVALSNHAGTFLCNHVFYTARAAIERRGRPVPCGFMHLPDLARTDAEGFERIVDATVAAVEMIAAAGPQGHC